MFFIKFMKQFIYFFPIARRRSKTSIYYCKAKTFNFCRESLMGKIAKYNNDWQSFTVGFNIHINELVNVGQVSGA